MGENQKSSSESWCKMVYAVLLLYYVATDSNVSTADKAKIYGALEYFILPIVLIPDITPGIGYTDDMAALMWPCMQCEAM